MGFIINYCIIVFLTAFWLSLGNTADHVMRTRRQLNAVHRSDRDLRQSSVHQLFAKSPDSNNNLLYLIGKALAEKNDEFNNLKSSKIDYVDAYLDVINKALDDNMNSVVNLTIVLKASKQLKANNPTQVNVPLKGLVHSTETKVKNWKSKDDDDKLSTFEKAVLDTHNFYRKKHGVPLLTFNAGISQVSQDWANNLAKRNAFEHRPNGEFGENIYAIQSTDPKFKVTGQMPVDAWYTEIGNYTFTREPSMDVIMKTGHFTQLVWKTSKELGIGLAQSKSTNMYYVVCNYNPRGNWIGEFRQNVNPPLKRN